MPPTQDTILRTGRRIEPFEFAPHLHRQFARRRDHQGERVRRRAETLRAVQQRRRHGQAECDRLARAGLGRNQQVGARRRGQHLLLDGGEDRVAVIGEGSGENRRDAFEVSH